MSKLSWCEYSRKVFYIPMLLVKLGAYIVTRQCIRQYIGGKNFPLNLVYWIVKFDCKLPPNICAGQVISENKTRELWQCASDSVWTGHNNSRRDTHLVRRRASTDFVISRNEVEWGKIPKSVYGRVPLELARAPESEWSGQNAWTSRGITENALMG